MSKAKEKIQTIPFLRNYRYLFFITSLLFALIFCFINITADDEFRLTSEVNTSFAAIIHNGVMEYQTWTSRFLVNLVMRVVTVLTPLFPVMMFFSSYLFQYSLSELFDRVHTKESTLFIACISYCLPWSELCSAGWIATLTTYYLPAAFGLFALIPIKKCLDGRRITWKGAIAYSLALIYSANNEQIMAILLACYFIFFIYFIVKRKLHIIIFTQFILTIASAVFILTCPGNSVRSSSELRWFPTFESLRLANKIELGFSTTAHHLLFAGILIVMFMEVILAITVCSKYKEKIFRYIACIPCVISVINVLFPQIFTNLIPFDSALRSDIPKYGLLNPDSYASRGNFVDFMILGVFLLLTFLSFLLASHYFSDLLLVFCLLGGGLAARAAVAFSPTIYASECRTFAPLYIIIIAATTLIFERNLEHRVYSVTALKWIHIVSAAALLMSFLILGMNVTFIG